MESDFLTQGPVTPLFEKELQSFCNAKYAMASVNATSALPNNLFIYWCKRVILFGLLQCVYLLSKLCNILWR